MEEVGSVIYYLVLPFAMGLDTTSILAVPAALVLRHWAYSGKYVEQTCLNNSQFPPACAVDLLTGGPVCLARLAGEMVLIS